MKSFDENSNVGVLVLTLPQSLDRQARIREKLNHAEIPFEFFLGVDGRKDDDPSLRMYDEAVRLRFKGEPLSLGQLGCFASHYNIWQRCAVDNKSYVVLEDDISFDEVFFLEFLESLPLLPSNVECLRLFRARDRKHKEYFFSSFGSFNILRFTKGPMSAMGYYLTPAAARKFIKFSSPIFLPVDIYMDRYWINDVLCLGIDPPFVIHDYQFESVIGYEKRSSRRSWTVRQRREWFAVTERVRRFFYNLGFIRNLR